MNSLISSSQSINSASIRTIEKNIGHCFCLRIKDAQVSYFKESFVEAAIHDGRKASGATPLKQLSKCLGLLGQRKRKYCLWIRVTLERTNSLHLMEGRVSHEYG